MLYKTYTTVQHEPRDVLQGLTRHTEKHTKRCLVHHLPLESVNKGDEMDLEKVEAGHCQHPPSNSEVYMESLGVLKDVLHNLNSLLLQIGQDVTMLVTCGWRT